MSSGAGATSVWVVESIAGVPTVDPKPEISLTEDGRLVGTTGINQIKGTYEAHDETVRITGSGMTRMAGTPEAMDQERRFLKVLEGWNAFYVRDDTLEVGAPDTGLVCVSSLRPPPA
jgi:heat shock protein HslJ